MKPNRKIACLLVFLIVTQFIKAQVASFELLKPEGSAAFNADFPYVQYGKMYKGFIDFDGDKDLDVLFQSVKDRTYYVYENDGNGDFTQFGEAPFNPYLGKNFIFQSYVFEDFNGDKIQDLLNVEGATEDSIILYLGDGAGNFVESPTKLIGGEQCTIIPADMDADGDMDVFITCKHQVSQPFYNKYCTILYLNDGSGHFTERAISLESDWAEIAVSKPFNGNMRNLVVIGTGFSDGLGNSRIYHFDGEGKYTLISDASFSNIQAFKTKVQMGDVTGDGKEDILFSSPKNGILFYKQDNDTTYSFLAGSNLDALGAGNDWYQFAFADFNLDGKHDLIYSTGKNGSRIYLCDGNGQFTLSESFPFQDKVNSYDFGDLNGDGYPEFLERGNLGDEDFLQLFVNDGDGTFTVVKNNITKEIGKGRIHVADFDSDIDNDILIFGEPHSTSTESDLYLNDGSGSFTNTGSLTLNQTFPSITEDFNNDGIQDLLVGKNVYINDGNANFSLTSDFPFTSNASDGDILKFNANNDYAADILFCGDGSVSLFRNNGGGHYKPFLNTGLVGCNNAAADAGDLDGDGDMDLVIGGVLQSGDTATIIYINNGDAFFTKASIHLPGIADGDVKIADINNDGEMDILMAGSDYQAVYLNNGDGKFFTLHQEFEGLSKATLACTDIDFDGDIDFVSTGTPETSIGLAVTKLYLNDGSGTFTDSGIDFRGVENAAITFADLDGDFDMDLFLAGSEPEYGAHKAYVARVYKNTTSIETINKKVKVCGSYYFLDEFLTKSGNYSKTILTDEGKNRTINLQLTVGGGSNDTIEVSANGYYSFNGDLLRESGIYSATFVNSTGCDSIVTLNLTLTDYVAQDDYECIAYQLIQPDSTVQLGVDFFPSTYGQSQAFDMDGDGDTDYLCIGKILDNNSNVMGYINQGNGIFVWEDYSISLSKSTTKPTILHGDLNGDGIEDLIISGERYSDNAVDLGTAVYFRDATKGYVLQDTISIPSTFYGCIGMADLTGDSIQDLLVGDYARKGIFLYRNDGTGNFTDTLLTPFTFSWEMAISEPYNSGTRDVLIADYASGYKFILCRFDSAGFVKTSSTFVSNYGTRAYFADANNDGAPDALISGSSDVKLYMNDGAGTYTFATNFNKNRSAIQQFKFIDLNNDHAAEVIIDKPQYPNNDKLLVYWNDGTGNFSTIDTLDILNNHFSGGYVISAGDLNDDGFADIYFNGQDKYKQWRFGGWINNKSGGFDELAFNLAANVDFGNARFEDFNGDDSPDMIVTGNNKKIGPVTELYTNDGTGKFEKMASHSIDSLINSSIAFADIDGNSTKELVIMGTNKSDSVITKLYIHTGGIFAESNQKLNDVANGAVAFLYANKDDFHDLLTVGSDSLEIPQAFLYLNDGAGNFTPVSSGIIGLKSAALSIGDVNGDLLDDILLTGKDAYNDNHTTLYFSNGDGTFSADNVNVLVTASDAQIVDVDGDKDMDIYLGGTGIQYIYVNDGAGHFSLQHQLDQISNSKAQFDDIDLDGDMDILVSGKWQAFGNSTHTFLYINDGSGNFTLSTSNLLQSVYNGSLHVMDIDGDLDKDLVLTGTANSTTNTTRVYRNITCCPANIQTYENACKPYVFYGDSIYETGVYTHDISTVEGCTRTVTLNYTFTGTEILMDTMVCESIEFNGETLNTTGLYKAYFNSKVGCDSIAILNLFVTDTCATVAINSIHTNDVRIYPNPVNNFIHIDLPIHAQTSVVISDVSGRRIMTQSIDTEVFRINVSNLQKGTYILSIFNEGVQIKNTLFMKE